MANKAVAFFKKALDFNGVPTENGGNRLSVRNFFMFPLGTLGRDFLYQLFNGFLLTFILVTKNLTEAQFGSISFIIIAARIFDAFNDPIMGGIVENTRTKWGKYKPWQLIGSLLTGFVVIAVFCIPLDGWGYIGMLAVAYIMFSITFTMNDISYWGMMPSLTSHPGDRNKLSSFAQICAGAGMGLVGIIVPAFTAGAIAEALGGAVSVYRGLAIASAVLMIGFQLFTILGVKEKPLEPVLPKADRMTIKKIFKTILKNDQLVWSALVFFLSSLGSGLVTASLSMYFYFEFGYEGGYWTIFGIGMTVMSAIFTVIYPWLAKKLGIKKSFATIISCQIGGFLLMMILGMAVPSAEFLSSGWWAKFVPMAICYGIAGLGQGLYMIMMISIANTVEYNEWKTGKREEGVIFSVRPFITKLSSAVQLGLTTLIYIIAGVLTYTNQISDAENGYYSGAITDLNGTIKDITTSVPQENKMILIGCLCGLAIVLLAASVVIYMKKYKLDEATLENMVAEIEERKASEVSEDENAQPAEEVALGDEIAAEGEDSVVEVATVEEEAAADTVEETVEESQAPQEESDEPQTEE